MDPNSGFLSLPLSLELCSYLHFFVKFIRSELICDINFALCINAKRQPQLNRRASELHWQKGKIVFRLRNGTMVLFVVITCRLDIDERLFNKI